MRLLRERGAALVTVLAVTMALAALAAVLLTITAREIAVSIGHRLSLEAFYLAEGAAHLTRASLHRLVVLGLNEGLHWRSLENAGKLHAHLARLVAGTGTLEGSCGRATSSDTQELGGSNSIALFDMVGLGAANASAPAANATTAFAQSVRYRFAPLEGDAFGLLPDGQDDVITPLGVGTLLARATVARDGNAWAESALPGCPGEPRYFFPFRYTIDAEGRTGPFGRRRVSLSGKFQVVIERPSFSQYFLFSNIFGTRPVCPNRQPCRRWLSAGAVYEGPVHTNERLWIAGDPLFMDRATSANFRDSNGDGELSPELGDRVGQPVARFYNGGLECAGDAEPGGWCDRNAARNLPADAPRFLKGFDRGVPYVAMPVDLHQQEWFALVGNLRRDADGDGLVDPISNVDRRYALGLPVVTADVPPDVFLPTGANESRVDRCYFAAGEAGGRLRGGIYVGRSLRSLRLSVDGRMSVYELTTDPDHWWTIRVDRAAQLTKVFYSRKGTPLECTYQGVPNGIIFVRGDIDDLTGPPRRRVGGGEEAAPAVHQDDAITVVATGTIRIGGDLRYQVDPRGPDDVWGSPPCSGDDRCGVRNLLGIYSFGGEVLVGKDAPDDVVIHAVLMAGHGSVGVAEVETRSSQGTLHLLGGKINRYEGLFRNEGSFGRFGGGYLPDLRFDHRLGIGLREPPGFPRLQVLAVRTTPGLDSRPAWTERP
ncbi:MAG: DUF4900 domain-containing protein [Acidobacteria bacterium]|nr:DUF4900 domain-containing protein [Acidobacteriota bacterium]